MDYLYIVFLCVLVERWIVSSLWFWNYCYYYSVSKTDDRIRFEAQIDRSMNEKNKTFFVGSSQTREDVDIEKLHVASPVRSYFNLGVSGATYAMDLYLAKDKLINAAPKIIVYMPSMASFYEEPDFQNRIYSNTDIFKYIVQFFGWRGLLQQWRPLANGFVDYISPLHKYSGSIKNIIFHSLLDRIGVMTWTKYSVYALNQNQPESYFTAIIDVQQMLHQYRYTETSYTPFMYQLFTESARAFKAKGIRFIVTSAPLHPLASSLYDPVLFKKYEERLQQLSSELGYELVLQRNLPKFDKGDFIDFYHLNAKGRTKFTDFLSSYLQNMCQVPHFSRTLSEYFCLN